MAITYPTGCDTLLDGHVCDPCQADEHGRVRGVAFYDADYTFSDLGSSTEWDALLAAGRAWVIQQTNGEYDGGSPTFTEGFGDAPQSYSSSEFKLVYNDPTFIGNRDFYNALNKTRDKKVAWRSETIIQTSDVAVTVFAKSAIENDVKSKRVWNVEVTFSQADEPVQDTVPAGIFDLCYNVT